MPSAATIERARRIAAYVPAALPPKVLRRLAGPPVVIDGLELDPEMQTVLRALEMTGAKEWPDLGPEQARIQTRIDARAGAVRVPQLAEVRAEAVEGAAGPLAARLYVPQGAPSVGPLLVYFHGGGFIIGDLDTHDQPCRFLATTAGLRVLSVAYRLGPEDPFPAAPDDALAAFRFVAANARRFGADPDRIAVGGDSAGANLAIVVCNDAAVDGGPSPAFQLDIYPVTDTLADTPSRGLFAEGFFLTKRNMDWATANYLARDEDARDPRVSPLLATDLAGVAPAYVCTAGFDPLRDEGEAYVERLREAGVPVTHRRHDGLIHGFANMTGVTRSARLAMTEAAHALRTNLT